EEEVITFDDAPRTPNGAEDLLSGNDDGNINNNGPPLPSSSGDIFVINDDDDDEEDEDEEDNFLAAASSSTTLPPPHLLSSNHDSNLVFEDNKNDEEKVVTDDCDASSSPVYERLNSFAKQLHSELKDMEKETQKNKKKKKKKKRQQVDPDGSGAREPSSSSSVSSSSSSKQSKPKKNLAMAAMLSGKTDKIMSDYQAYLEEIQTDRLTSFSSSSSDGSSDGSDEIDPALATIHQVRENVRYTGRHRMRYRHARSPSVKRGIIGMIALCAVVIGVSVHLAIGGGSGDGNDEKKNHTVESNAHIKKENDESLLSNWDVEYEAEMEEEAELYGGKFYGDKEDESDGEEEDNKAPGLANAAVEAAAAAFAASESESESDNDNDKGNDGSGQGIALSAPQQQFQGSNVLQKEILDQQQQQVNIDEWKGQFHANQEKLKQIEKDQMIVESKPTVGGGDDDGTTTSNYYLGGWQQAKDTGILDLYTTAVKKYKPLLFDRSSGWNGQTYVEALIFCESQNHLAVCPYDAVCPNGTHGEPLGGFRLGPHGDWAWVPIINDHNEWVQAGAREKCIRYKDKFGGEVGPEWGLTGNDSADITENVMCCLEVM
ncbi:hypothetical protein ACHAXR_008943, partial [Thalassiosira sp. AJA248-18]